MKRSRPQELAVSGSRLPGEPLDLLLGEEGVEKLIDDEIVVVGEGLDRLKLPWELAVFEAGLGSPFRRPLDQVFARDADGVGEATASHVVTQGSTAGLLTSVPQFASAITYHPNGLWAHVVHTNGVTDVQEADVSGLGRPGRLSTTGASDNFDSGAIAYDGAGNVTKMGADRYVYDLLSRVSEAAVEVPHESCGQLTVVQGKTDTTTKSYQSCGTVQAGLGYTVGSGGNVTLTAGHQVVFASGFSVASGGRLAAGVDPALDPPGQPTAAGQTYTFDRFGNLTQITTSREGHADEVQGIGTFSNTNRLSAGGYDDAGNLISFPGVSWTYDPFNMMTQEASSAGSHFDFVYGPGDERLWTIDWSGRDGADPSNWRETWTLRDLDGSPLRQYVSIGGNNAKANWQAANPNFPRDYAWRGGSLLASVTQAGLTRHDHLDHLGSPRIVTDAAGKTLALHLYFPFGQEATEPDQDDLALKFTGHERDDLDSGGTSYDLDYMHARYYSPLVGRFLSVDVLGGVPGLPPQSWDRYSYVLGNPVKYIDPTGEYPSDIIGQIGQDYLQCLINGGCEYIQVNDQARGFNPFTGVQGLGDLITGRLSFNMNVSGLPRRNGLDTGRNEFRLNFIERGLSTLPIKGTQFGMCVEKNRFDFGAITAFSIGNPLLNKLAGSTGRMGFGGLGPHPTTWEHKLGARLARTFDNPAFSRVGKFAGRAALGVTVFEGFYDIGTIGRCAVVTGGN